MTSLGIGIVGYGYWGPNLARNFAAAAGCHLAAIADGRPSARASIGKNWPAAKLFDNGQALIADSGVDAVVIATPIATHYELARQALDRGKHVLVEKPLCQTSEQAKDLVARADRVGRVLMVDHTFLFSGAVECMTGIVRKGDLGEICYFDSVRVNLGLFQPDVNCLWDLAPHDLSIVDSLIDDDVVAIDATGYCHLNPGVPDIVHLTLHYARNAIAHFHLSWMSPVKIRRFTVGGKRKMLIWDDLDQDQKIKVYDHGIEIQAQDRRDIVIPDYRIGDIFSPRTSRREALAVVAEHFVSVIAGRSPPIMDGRRGLRIVHLLEEAQSVLDRNLTSVATLRAGSVAKVAFL